MLRATSSAKAKAARIISDLRSQKAAVAVYQVDEGVGAPTPSLDDLRKHMDRTIPAGYNVGDKDHYWFVFYDDTALGGSGLAKSLANSAQDIGLYRSMVASPDLEPYTGVHGENTVYMRVH
jgi:hypothetical protein